MTTTTIALLTWPTAFILGVLVGRYIERHKETTMQIASRARGWYDNWAPIFVMVVAALALIGIWIGTAASITNGRQDDQRAAEAAIRDDQTRTLLDCFDEYAAAQFESSVAVREAAVVKDEAAAARDRALRDLTRALRSEDEDVRREAFEHLASTSDDLVHAQAALDRAREKYPVPPPPSSFCDVKP